jgi:hypothetical protein
VGMRRPQPRADSRLNLSFTVGTDSSNVIRSGNLVMRFLSLFSAAVVAAVASFVAVPDASAREPGVEKLNAYIGCYNRHSERAYLSRSRYFSWAAKSGPTGKEKLIYGTYTISDPADCAKEVAHANQIEPRDAKLESAGSAYVAAVSALAPVLKEADDYYTQADYKDDKMAKGKALHPRLIAAWAAFESADTALSSMIDEIQDRNAAQQLVEIERSEGRKGRYHIASLMLRAKALVRVQGADKADLAKITEALGGYEAAVKAAEDYAASKSGEIGSSFLGSAKSYLVTAKHLMRRVRDKVAYNQGERMILNTGNGAWMVEGSPARLSRDYNELIESYNRSPGF